MQNITAFFHPLDLVGEWNRVYGPRGFLQYQFVVPFGAGDRAPPDRRADRGLAARCPCLNVLKRFGAGQPGAAVVPDAGLDAHRRPARSRPACDRFCDELDELVLERRRPALPGQGLAAHRRDRSSAGTRGFDEWRKARDAVDPDGLFVSDMARRLELSARDVRACEVTIRHSIDEHGADERQRGEVVIDAVGNPQSILLLGGTSEIGLAIVEAFASDRPLRVVLAGAAVGAADAAARTRAGGPRLRASRRSTSTPRAARHARRRRPQVLRGRRRRRRRGRVRPARRRREGVDGRRRGRGAGDGELHGRGRGRRGARRSGCASRATARSSRCRRSPASGRGGRTSSTAPRRPASTPSTSASTEALRPHGVGVTVVRPGFVHTRMTEGMKPAPLSTTPEAVAAAVVDAVRNRREQVWVAGAAARGDERAAAPAPPGVPPPAGLSVQHEPTARPTA